MKRTRRYAADTIGLALYFRVVEFQVRLKVEADGLQAEIVDLNPRLFCILKDVLMSTWGWIEIIFEPMCLAW
jgi:hypothetical protein